MTQPEWWKRGIIYQIYPRSFQDTNGDGIGDLEGIRRRLDYLDWLGIDAIWISPIYPSPMADFGYDIADYCGIAPIFGTLDDFDRLIEEAHRRGLKVILDFVPNHTSDQHPWFVESRSSRDNPKRDWYLWCDPRPDGGPPNNWMSNFGGSGWEFDERTGQYYYHAFLKEQPDLNWRNPEVRAAMHDVLRFWMRRGVDGFRVDVMWHLMKDPEFRDDPVNVGYQEGQPDIKRVLQVHSTDHPDIHDVVSDLRSVLEEFPERVLIGEIYLPVERLVAYYGDDLSGAHLPFNFQLIFAAWNAAALGRMIDEYESVLPDGGWPNWVLGNHDQKRIAARVGHEEARVATMLLLTLRGTPTMYYGDELGIGQVEIPPEAVQDPWELNEPGLGVGRDPQRTPMPWNDDVNAGFSSGKPWLPLSHDWRDRNVEACRSDAASTLQLTCRLIELRSANRSLNVGDFRLLAADKDVLRYERSFGNERMEIVLNLGHKPQNVELSGDSASKRILLSTHDDASAEIVGDILELRPCEGVVIG